MQHYFKELFILNIMFLLKPLSFCVTNKQSCMETLRFVKKIKHTSLLPNSSFHYFPRGYQMNNVTAYHIIIKCKIEKIILYNKMTLTSQQLNLNLFLIHIQSSLGDPLVDAPFGTPWSLKQAEEPDVRDTFDFNCLNPDLTNATSTTVNQLELVMKIK